MIVGSDLSPYIILLFILLIYLIGGFVMDAMSMILITVPVFYPVLATLDFGLSPDGFCDLVRDIGPDHGRDGPDHTPPIGLNVYVVNSIAKDVPILETFKGVVPFLISDIIRVGLLIAVPWFALWWMV